MSQSQYHQQLLSYISTRVSITEADKRLISDAYTLLELKKKDHLFESGKPCKVEGFVVQGSFRLYYVDMKGLEHVLYFAFQDWWVGDIASFYTEMPAMLNAQALEDSKILVIDPFKKEELFRALPALERLFRIITQKHLVVLQKRFLLTVSANAVERYQELIKRSPGIEQLVPQHQIASYLGILPESLSRMKKQMLK